jgi:hypothetical protein
MYRFPFIMLCTDSHEILHVLATSLALIHIFICFAQVLGINRGPHCFWHQQRATLLLASTEVTLLLASTEVTLLLASTEGHTAFGFRKPKHVFFPFSDLQNLPSVF